MNTETSTFELLDLNTIFSRGYYLKNKNYRNLLRNTVICSIYCQSLHDFFPVDLIAIVVQVLKLFFMFMFFIR